MFKCVKWHRCTIFTIQMKIQPRSAVTIKCFSFSKMPGFVLKSIKLCFLKFLVTVKMWLRNRSVIGLTDVLIWRSSVCFGGSLLVHLQNYRVRIMEMSFDFIVCIEGTYHNYRHHNLHVTERFLELNSHPYRLRHQFVNENIACKVRVSVTLVLVWKFSNVLGLLRNL